MHVNTHVCPVLGALGQPAVGLQNIVDVRASHRMGLAAAAHTAQQPHGLPLMSSLTCTKGRPMQFQRCCLGDFAAPRCLAGRSPDRCPLHVRSYKRSVWDQRDDQSALQRPRCKKKVAWPRFRCVGGRTIAGEYHQQNQIAFSGLQADNLQHAQSVMEGASRYFVNTCDDGASDLTDANVSTTKLVQAVLSALQVLEREREDGLRGGSIYIGRAGLALAYLRVTKALLTGALPQETHTDYLQALDRALLHAEGALAELPPPGARHGRVSFLEGRPGALAVYAELLKLAGRPAEAEAAVQELVSLLPAVEALPPGECELLYGRAGYLYALLAAQPSAPTDVEVRAAVEAAAHHLADQILDAGEAGAAAPGMPPGLGLAFAWHGSQYLGAAHGTVGILQVLLLHLERVQAPGWRNVAEVDVCDPASDAALRAAEQMQRHLQRLTALIPQAIDGLLAQTFPSGNLPSSLAKQTDKLVSWCHGAPGLVVMLRTATRVLHGSQHITHPAWSAAAEAAADTIWRRGLLKKGLGLCHGITGNGYALLAAAEGAVDDIGKQQRRAMHFALFAADHWQELYHVPDAPASLYEGLAGAVCFWLDVLGQRTQASAFPGFDL